MVIIGKESNIEQIEDINTRMPINDENWFFRSKIIFAFGKPVLYHRSWLALTIIEC